jgi:hypothetical protein
MVKRISSAVTKKLKISQVAVDAFKEALPLRLHREEAIADYDACGGVGRCETCDRYEDLVLVLSLELKLRAAAISPIDAADVPPAPWLDEDKAEQWERARELYCLLCDAAGIDRAKRAEITDFVNHQRIIRWAERHCYVPEGPDVGKRLRLRPFQRDIVRQIYGNGFGEDGDVIREALGCASP